jgi:YVTN family beta-propeller protein
MMRKLCLALFLVAGCHDDDDDDFVPGSTPTGVIAQIQLPASGPFGAKVTPDGKLLFVPCFGTFTPWVVGNTVAVIDASSLQLVAQVGVGDRPEDVDFLADGSHAYVTNSESSTVSVLHVPTLSVVATIPVGVASASYPYGLSIRGTKAYVFTSGGNFDGDDDNIVVLDVDPSSATFNTVLGKITLSGVYTRGDFSGTTLVVPRGAAGNDFNAIPEIAFFDTTTDAYLSSIQIQQAPGGFHSFEDLCVTPNGDWAYVASFNSGSGTEEVYVIDLQNQQLYDVLTLTAGGISSHGIGVRGDGLLVGVTGWDSGRVSFLFTPTNTVIYEYATGANPNEVAFSPDGRRAYVTNQNSQTVTVIALPDARTLLETVVNGGTATPTAAADLQWRLGKLREATDPAEVQVWVDNLAIWIRYWDDVGEFEAGDPKDAAPAGAALNGVTVRDHGILGGVQ